MKEQHTAIIEKVTVGMVDHYPDIMVSCVFNMDGAGCCLTFSMDKIKEMMKDAGVYDDIQHLVGKPCEILGGWGEFCEFVRMWKK